MSEEIITRMSLAEALNSKGQTDWAKVAAASDDDSDPTEDEFDWANAQMLTFPLKQAVSIRLDDDVLQFFRASGKGYQTRINAVLRSYVAAKQR